MTLGKRWKELKAEPSFRRAVRGTVGHIVAMLFVVLEPLSFPGSCLVPIIHLVAAGIGASDLQFGATLRCCITLLWGSLMGCLVSVAILSVTGPYKLASIALMLLVSIPINTLKLSPNILLVAINANLAMPNIIVKSPEEWLTWESALNLCIPSFMSTLTAGIITTATALFVYPTFSESELQKELSVCISDIGTMLTDFSSRMLSKGGVGEHAAAVYTEAEFLSRVGVRPQREKSVYERAVQAKGQLLRKVNTRFLRLNTLMEYLAYEPFSSKPSDWSPIRQRSKILLDHVFVLMMTLSGFSARQCSDETIEHWWGSMRDVWKDNFAKCTTNIHIMAQLVGTLHRQTMSKDDHDQLLLSLRKLTESIEQLVGSIRNGFVQSFQNNLRRTKYLEDPTPPWELRILYFTTFYYGRTRAAILDLAHELNDYHIKHGEQNTGFLSRFCFPSYSRLIEMRDMKPGSSEHRTKMFFRDSYILDLFVEPFRVWKRIAINFPRNRQKLTEVLKNEKVRYMIKHTIALAIIFLPNFILPRKITEHMQEWFGVWSYITVVLVFQRAVESTVFKGFLRIVATISGATLAGVYLLSEEAASEPLLICTFLAPWVFIALYNCQGRFHYGAFIFMVTMTLVIACQYSPDVHMANWKYPASRCTSIIGGCLAAWFVNQIIWPFWGADAVRNKLAKVMRLTAELYCAVLSKYESGENSTESDGLQDDKYVEELIETISLHLDQAQELNSKDTAAWTKFSLMNLPQEYKNLMENQRLVLIYLQVLHSIISRDPVLTGKYSGTIDNIYMRPLVEQKTQLKEYFVQACELISNIVRPKPSHGFVLHFDHFLQKPVNLDKINALRALMAEFRDCRRNLVVLINQRRQEVIENWAETLSERDRRAEEMEKGQSDIRVVRCSGPRMPFNVDDSLRFFAYLYAKSSALDIFFQTAEQLYSVEERESPSPTHKT